MKLPKYAEFYVVAAMFPLFLGGCCMGGYRLLMWSYGGADNFTYLLLKEPMEKQWFNVNPKKVFFRDAPLSAVPDTEPEGLVEKVPHPHQQEFK
jgi:hypothetical protein